MWIDTNSCSETMHEFYRDDEDVLRVRHVGDGSECELVEFDASDARELVREAE